MALIHVQRVRTPRMIDTFSLALSHGLLLLAAWRLLARPDLDDDQVEPPAPAIRADPWAAVGDGAKDRA